MSHYLDIYECHIQVRWGDCDSMSHVNNAKYFTYAEQARMEWLMTLPPELPGTSPVIAAADMTFKKPIYFPGQVIVKLSVGDAGRTSFKLKHEIYVDSQLHAHGTCTLVWIDIKTGATAGLPLSLVKLIPPRDI